MSFADLGLSDKVLKAAEAAGYTSPTPIQKQAIPLVLARRDVLGIAQTGTGKTAAFTLPMLTLLESGRARARMPRTLILEPTRELAAQVEENFIKYGSQHKLSVALLIGGVSFGDQDAKITRGADVLIATPGRLLDHFERGKLLLTGVELFVIDEADRMLDMGFIPDIERIAKLVPFTRQTLFFSATMPPEVQKLADTFLHNPVKVEVARASSTASTITQLLASTGSEPHQKRATLRDLIRSAVDLKNAIIFCNRKRDVATLHRSLLRHGFSVEALHGDMDQRSRMQALDNFRNGETALLVASDVAARGLDIPDVSHVFNYDVPFHAEDYVHRIGRTGRAGRHGTAISLVARGDDKSLQAIESLIGKSIDWQGKPLSERTEEDDAYSSPDRGVGWRRDDHEQRGGRNKRRRRGKERDRGHDGERRSQHSETNERQTHERSAQERPAHGHSTHGHPTHGHSAHGAHQENRRNENQQRDQRRDDHRQRRHRYDNEPDISVIGFGDHVPAFIRTSTGFSDLPDSRPSEHKHITPTSLPPRAIEEEDRPQTAPRTEAKEEPSNAASPPSTEKKARRKSAKKSGTDIAPVSEPILAEQSAEKAVKPKATAAGRKSTKGKSTTGKTRTGDDVAATTEDVPATRKSATKKKAASATEKPATEKKAAAKKVKAEKETEAGVKKAPAKKAVTGTKAEKTTAEKKTATEKKTPARKTTKSTATKKVKATDAGKE